MNIHVSWFTAVMLVIDFALVFWNGYLYGRRKQLRDDKKLFDAHHQRIMEILNRHASPPEPPKPDYIHHQ